MAYASAPVILDSTGQNMAASFSALAGKTLERGDPGADGNGVSSFVWYSNSGGQPQGTAGTIDTYRMTFEDGTYTDILVSNGADGGGSPVWGNITGVLSYQSDLQTDLNDKANNAKGVTVTISVADWVAKTATKTVTGVTSSNNIIVAPDPDDFIAYNNSEIRATAQGDGTVTFACEVTPSASVSVNILLVG